MTIQEMHYHIDQGLQKNASFVYGNFLSEEIDSFINKMILRFVKSICKPEDPRIPGFEDAQREYDEISNLITPFQATFNGLAAGANASLTLDSEYMHFVSGNVTAGLDKCNIRPDENKTENLPIRVIPHKNIFRANKDPFVKSSIGAGTVVTITGRLMTLYGDEKYILKGANGFYVRIPKKVSLSLGEDCELVEHTHDRIVDLTVQHILEVIESQRYQTNSAQTRGSE